MTERHVDARGLHCPWPALRLARAMREADRVTIVVDDPAAAQEIAALAAARGWVMSRGSEQFLLIAPAA